MGASTVWVKPLSGPWQPIGTTVDAGVWHEGLVAVSDQWGPKTLTFNLKRQRRAVFPDLLARTPVAVDVGGVRVWRGRISDAPEQSGAAQQITVTCTGGQTILDDDTLERILVHTKLADYRDQRTFLAADLTGCTQAWNIATDQGIVTIGIQNATTVGNGTFGGVTLDLGPSSTAKRIVVTWESSNNSPDASFRARGGNSASPTAGGDDAFTFALNTGASGTAQGSFTTDRRYVHLYVFSTINFAPALADIWLKIKTVQVFADTAYESGNASVLDARTIIVDGLTRATTGLHPDWSGIGAPSFSFPNFAPDAPRTPRELIAAANAPIPQWWFRVDEELRPLYQPRPTVPIVELGSWLGSETDNAASNTDDGVTTKVTVRGTGADGTPLRSTGTQTGTIVDRQGGVSAKTLDSSYTLTPTLADKLRDSYLAAHRVAPFKDQCTVGLNGARRAGGGGTLHPAQLLLLGGQLARRTDLVDPDTGGLGRVTVLDQITYRDDATESDLDLDNTRSDFDALNARVGLLVPTT